MMLLLLAVGCAAPLADSCACEVDADGWRPTWSNFGETAFTTWCASCHAASAPQRFGAPEDMVFDTEADVLARLEVVRAVTLGEAPSMPLGGGVPEDELAMLARYLDCLETE
jgi:hypothetical protein